RAEAVSSAEDFLTSGSATRTNCLILDVAMPGVSGPDLQLELCRRKQLVPIIFITAHRDEAVRSRLLRNGAVECLYKPFSDADLQKALDRALEASE
ncbi:MAG: response regulator, partial [Mesorhizobium sp.]